MEKLPLARANPFTGISPPPWGFGELEISLCIVITSRHSFVVRQAPVTATTGALYMYCGPGAPRASYLSPSNSSCHVRSTPTASNYADCQSGPQWLIAAIIFSPRRRLVVVSSLQSRVLSVRNPFCRRTTRPFTATEWHRPHRRLWLILLNLYTYVLRAKSVLEVVRKRRHAIIR